MFGDPWPPCVPPTCPCGKPALWQSQEFDSCTLWFAWWCTDCNAVVPNYVQVAE